MSTYSNSSEATATTTAMATETYTPVYTKFIPVEHKDITAVSSKADGLRFLVSYNILSQACIKNHNFPHSPSPCLEKELVLQKTVDYDDLAKLVLEESEQEKALDTNNIIRVKSSPSDRLVRFKRTNCVGIMAAFKFKKPHKHYVIVANTHIFWDPQFADVKLAQAKYLLPRVDQFKIMASEKFECKLSVLIAGDFNSVPVSKVYQYLVSGGPMAAPSPEHLEDLPMPLCSVHAYTRGEPPFTNCKPGFIGTLVYILFSPSESIGPVGYLKLPELGSPDLEGGLPNYYHPSDHLPIGAEFVVVKYN